MKCLILTIALFVVPALLPAAAIAQIPVDFDVGVRGGVFTGGVPLEVSNNHYFPDVYTTDQLQFPTTLGPTFGVLLNNHWYVHLEAARSRFRFHFVQGTNVSFPYSGSPAVASVTDGHVWQYPLLLSYIAGRGPIRPFGGGGLNFGTTFHGTTRTTTTTLVGPLPPAGSTGPFTTTSTTTSAPFDTRSDVIPGAFYITGGVDARLSHFSIRPELRYTHWTGFDTTDISFQDDSILYSRSQMEFLVTVSIHPFGKRGR